MAKKKHNVIVKKVSFSAYKSSFHFSLSSLLLLGFLILGIILGIYYLNQPQDIRSQAKGDECGGFGKKCCKKGQKICNRPNFACYNDTRNDRNRVCYPYSYILTFHGPDNFYNSPLPVKIDLEAYNFQPFNQDVEHVSSTTLAYDCGNGTPKKTIVIDGDGSDYKGTVRCVYTKTGIYEPSVVATAKATSGFLSDRATTGAFRVTGVLSPTATPKLINTATPTPKPSTPTPTVTKRPNGSDCTSGSQCQSGICKSCPDQGSKCRPNGYICPL